MRVALWLRQLPGTLKPQQLAHNALWCLGGLLIKLRASQNMAVR